MSKRQQVHQSKRQNPSFQNRKPPANHVHVSNPAAIIQHARINPESLTSAGVLQLQRTIGNRAVGRLLSEFRNPSTVQQMPIQRQKISEEEEPLQGEFENKPEEETCPSCIQRQEIPEEEESLQGKMADPVQYQEVLEEEKPLQTKRENNTGMPDNLKAGVENLSGIDMSDVKVHYNSDKPAKIGALAYTQGTNIHVAPGKEKHLPHEAWHVVQQAQGRVRPTVQMKGVAVNDDEGLESEADRMGESLLSAGVYNPRSIDKQMQSKPKVASRLTQCRRVPRKTDLAAIVPIGGPGLDSTRKGLARILSRSLGELSDSDWTKVKTVVESELGIKLKTKEVLFTWLNLAKREQLFKIAQILTTKVPTVQLGNPLLINIGPRPSKADGANITKLIFNAKSVFGSIVNGLYDKDIKDVFGDNVAIVKSKYAAANKRMNELKTLNMIVTDRSGYSDEVFLGGLSDQNQIALTPNVIDDPNNEESIITLIHESMHAGNSDIGDFGYIDQPSFKVLEESVKLKNAAHFEVVPRRILKANYAYEKDTFIPAGTTVNGTTAPKLTPQEEAIRGASETFRKAWTIGLNLHNLFVRVFRNPMEWNMLDLSTIFGAPAGARFENTLPFWSKVEMLTIHTRATSINPTGALAIRPVTLIDIALSEGLIRKLALGMVSVPQDPPEAEELEKKATKFEREAADKSANAKRDLLIKLVLINKLGSITGDENRDKRVVVRMARADTGDYSDILTMRPPSAFP